MLVFEVALFTVVALLLIVFRKPMAEFQSGVIGGRTMPGCVVAEAVALLVVAIVIFLLRKEF